MRTSLVVTGGDDIRVEMNAQMNKGEGSLLEGRHSIQLWWNACWTNTRITLQ